MSGPPRSADLFARLEQTTVSLDTRLNLTLTPEMTLEIFVRPFVSADEYTGFKRPVDPRARTLEEQFESVAGREPEGFNIRSLQGNAVFR